MDQEPVAKGWRGTIYLQNKHGRKIATKQANADDKAGAISKEVQILRYLANYDIDFVPVILEEVERGFSYEWIEGEHFEDVWKRSGKYMQRTLALQLLDRAYALDQIGVIHGELIRPTKNVLVDPQGQIWIIDFERGKFGDMTGKNMRSLSQWFLSQELLSQKECKHIGSLQPEQIYLYLRQQLGPYLDTETLKATTRIGLLTVIDQLTKRLFYNHELWSDTRLLQPAFNTGSGRSLAIPIWLTLALTFAVLVFIGYSLINKRYRPRLLIFLAAGSLGNGIDRIVLGGVRDFIDLHYRPVFNIADVYLTVAAAILIYSIIRNSRTMKA